MKHATLIGLILSAAAFGQRPQLTWDGFVDGTATLYIQGRNVDAQGRTTGSVDRPRARFQQPLPAAPQTIDVQVKRGNGTVSVVEQPSRQNDFSAVVEIVNRAGGGQNYSLDFFWDPNAVDGRGRGRGNVGGGRGRNMPQDNSYGGAARATWSGIVDAETIVLFRGRQAFTTAVRGQRTTQEQTNFTAPLPRQDVTVRLEGQQGRGQIELLEQPGADNNYTAKVRVLDDSGGASNYSFTLSWNDAGGVANNNNRGRNNRNDSYNDGNVLTPGGIDNGSIGNDRRQNRQNTNYSGGNVIRWSGRVDNKVQVIVQGNRVYSQRVEGAEVSDERIDMGSPLPYNAAGNVEINKLRGRGDVRILSKDGDRVVIEIRDNDGGADTYEVELRWR